MYSAVFCCSTCLEWFTRSSWRALPNILYHAVWYNRAAVQLDSSARLYRLYCVIQYTKQCSWWWTSNSFEICRARKYVGIKIIYRTVHVVGHLHIAIWCTVHTTLNWLVCVMQVFFFFLLLTQELSFCTSETWFFKGSSMFSARFHRLSINVPVKCTLPIPKLRLFYVFVQRIIWK